MAKKIVDENGEIMYLHDDFDEEEFPDDLPEELDEEALEEVFEPARRQQVQERIKELKIPVDKLSCCLWDHTDAEFADIVNNRRQCGCLEGLVKGKQVVTPYFLSLIEDYADLSALNPWHREILFHAINLYANGYNLITISMTYDSMTGGAENRHLQQNTARFEAIKAAIKKLAFTGIRIDLEPLIANYPKYRANYKRYCPKDSAKKGKAELMGTLLPAQILDEESAVNGQKTFAVKILGDSPLMILARIKQQIMHYNTEPLAIDGQKGTVQVVVIKNYLLRRIELMKQRRMSRSIVFTTLYKECGLGDAEKWQKQDARKVVEETLEAFKAAGVIKDFQIERKAGKYRAIKITLEQSLPAPKKL